MCTEKGYHAYMKNPRTKWFDGCTIQNECLCLDDVSMMDINAQRDLSTNLKEWSNLYSFVAEKKNSWFFYRPKMIVITSQYSISDVFYKLPVEEIDALTRRFKVVWFQPANQVLIPGLPRLDHTTENVITVNEFEMERLRRRRV